MRGAQPGRPTRSARVSQPPTTVHRWAGGTRRRPRPPERGEQTTRGRGGGGRRRTVGDGADVEEGRGGAGGDRVWGGRRWCKRRHATARAQRVAGRRPRPPPKTWAVQRVGWGGGMCLPGSPRTTRVRDHLVGRRGGGGRGGRVVGARVRLSGNGWPGPKEAVSCTPRPRLAGARVVDSERRCKNVEGGTNRGERSRSYWRPQARVAEQRRTTLRVGAPCRGVCGKAGGEGGEGGASGVAGESTPPPPKRRARCALRRPLEPDSD